MREKLPDEVEQRLPAEIVRHIYSFLPYPPKKKTPAQSPSLQKELERIQAAPMKGTSAMFLKDLGAFCLD
jgi:hypothetical protein